MKFAQSSIEDTQALALWYFTKECNFHCPYCKIGRANSDHGIARRISTMGKKIMRRLTGLPADPLEGSSKIIKLLKNEEGKKWTIGLTGGEPFMYPRFVQLCETLTEHFCIYVDTNLSISRRVAEFAVMQKLAKRELGELYGREFIQVFPRVPLEESWSWWKLNEKDERR